MAEEKLKVHVDTGCHLSREWCRALERRLRGLEGVTLVSDHGRADCIVMLEPDTCDVSWRKDFYPKAKILVVSQYNTLTPECLDGRANIVVTYNEDATVVAAEIGKALAELLEQREERGEETNGR